MNTKSQAQTTLESMGWKFDMDSYMAQNNNTMLEKRVEWQDNGSICFYVVKKMENILLMNQNIFHIMN